MLEIFLKWINPGVDMPSDSKRLTDKEFDILIKLVNRQSNALEELSVLDDGNERKISFFKTLAAKLHHTKANGICSKRAEINATTIKAFCGDKEKFQLDLTR